MKEGEKNTDKTLKEILNENDFPFVKDYKVFRTLGLKPLERAVLSEILSFNVQDKEYTGSFNYICSEFNVTSKTALKALNNLIDKGYILKKASKGRKTSIYSINEIKIKSLFLNSRKIRELKVNSGEIPQLDASTVEKLHSKQCKNSTVNSGETPHNKNIYKNKYKNNNNNNSGGITTIEKQNNELEDVCNMYKREISNKIDCSPLETDNLQKLIEEYGADKVKEAIGIAVEQNKKKLGYIKGVLKNKEAEGNSQPQEVQPPIYKEWNGDENDETKPPLTEAEKAELEKRAKEAREKLKTLTNIISQN